MLCYLGYLLTSFSAHIRGFHITKKVKADPYLLLYWSFYSLPRKLFSTVLELYKSWHHAVTWHHLVKYYKYSIFHNVQMLRFSHARFVTTSIAADRNRIEIIYNSWVLGNFGYWCFVISRAKILVRKNVWYLKG